MSHFVTKLLPQHYFVGQTAKDTIPLRSAPRHCWEKGEIISAMEVYRKSFRPPLRLLKMVQKASDQTFWARAEWQGHKNKSGPRIKYKISSADPMAPLAINTTLILV